MSDVIAHAASCALQQTASESGLRQPDLFERSIWLVNEISGAVENIATTGPSVAVRIKVARAGHDLDALEAANRELLAMVQSTAILSDTLAKQIDKLRAGLGEKR